MLLEKDDVGNYFLHVTATKMFLSKIIIKIIDETVLSFISFWSFTVVNLVYSLQVIQWGFYRNCFNFCPPFLNEKIQFSVLQHLLFNMSNKMVLPLSLHPFCPSRTEHLSRWSILCLVKDKRRINMRKVNKHIDLAASWNPILLKP